MAASMSLRLARRIIFKNNKYLPAASRQLNYSTGQNDEEVKDKIKSGYSNNVEVPKDKKIQDGEPMLTKSQADKDIVKNTVGTTSVPKSHSKSNISLKNRVNTKKLTDKVKEETEMSFASMLRKSSLMMIGDFKGSRLIGHIIEVQDDDLYIDFGGKFFCVCPRPEPKGEYYKGRTVDIMLQEWEMSSKFIGSDKHTTLLEADATLLGLSKSRSKASQEELLDTVQNNQNSPVNLSKSVI